MGAFLSGPPSREVPSTIFWLFLRNAGVLVSIIVGGGGGGGMPKPVVADGDGGGGMLTGGGGMIGPECTGGGGDIGTECSGGGCVNGAGCTTVMVSLVPCIPAETKAVDMPSSQVVCMGSNEFGGIVFLVSLG